MNTGHPDDDRPMSTPAPSPEERLRLAVKEYQDAMWAANTPASSTNHSLRAWMDIVNVHGLIHFDKRLCGGPAGEAMAIDSPPPCELATAEQDAKDRVMQAMGHLIENGWAITATIERAMP